MADPVRFAKGSKEAWQKQWVTEFRKLLFALFNSRFSKNMPRDEHSLRHGPRPLLLFNDKVKYFVNSALGVPLLCQPLAVMWMTCVNVNIHLTYLTVNS